MTHRPARLQHLHEGPIKGLDVVADWTATGGADGAVRVLARNGEHVGARRVHDDIVNSVAVGRDGRIASGSRDRTVRLYDPKVGRSYVIGEHDHWVMSVAWSEDGSRLVTGSEDGTIGLWEPEGASVTRRSLGYPVNGVSWQKEVIAAVTGDGVLHLLQSDGTPRRTLPGASQILWSVALSPDAATVAWAGRDRHLRIAPVEGGEPIAVPAHRAQVWSVRWDEGGERVATAAADGTVAVWRADGTVVERLAVPAWARGAAFRGLELYVATEDGALRIFDSDGADPPPPPPIEVPDPPEACLHWDPQVSDAGFRPRCAECGSAEEARLCVTCGHVGCCESQLAHGTKHWLETGHPNTVPAVAGPFRWRWCYEDDMYVKR